MELFLTSLQPTHYGGNELLLVAVMSFYDLQLAAINTPIHEMWSCCAWIHRGVICTHSSHCLRALLTELATMEIKLESLCVQ